MLHSGLKVCLLQKWCFYWILTVHSCTGGVNISYNHLLFCENQEFLFSSMNCFSFIFGMMLSHVTAEDNPLVLTWFYKLWELKSEITSLHSSGLCLWVCYDKCVVDSVLKLVSDCTYTQLLHLVTTSHHLHVHTHTHTQKGLLVRLGCCSSSKSSVGRYILTTIRNGWVVSEWPPLQLPLATWERSYSYLGLARVRWQPGRFLFLTHTHIPQHLLRARDMKGCHWEGRQRSNREKNVFSMWMMQDWFSSREVRKRWVQGEERAR